MQTSRSLRNRAVMAVIARPEGFPAELCLIISHQHAGWLGTLTADQIPADRTWFVKKGAELARMHGRSDAGTSEQIEFATYVLLCAVGAALVRQGWAIETAPGHPLTVVKSGARFEPHISIAQLADGSMNVEYWKTQCASLGIAGMPLSQTTATPQSRIA